MEDENGAKQAQANRKPLNTVLGTLGVTDEICLVTGTWTLHLQLTEIYQI